MSEDSNFNKNKPQMNADERRCGVDFSGSMEKGMLVKEKMETLGNSSGLTPLNYDTETPMDAVKGRYSPQRTLRTQSLGLTNLANQGE